MGGLFYSTTPRAIGSLLSQILGINFSTGIIIAMILLVSAAVVFLLFVLYGGDILSLVGEAFSFNGGVGIIVTLGVFWKKGTKKGASIGIWSSLVAGLAWYFLKHPWGISTVWITMAIGLLVFVIVSLFMPEEDSEYRQQRFRRAISDRR